MKRVLTVQLICPETASQAGGSYVLRVKCSTSSTATMRRRAHGARDEGDKLHGAPTLREEPSGQSGPMLVPSIIVKNILNRAGQNNDETAVICV
jgi:hypothetical protein